MTVLVLPPRGTRSECAARPAPTLFDRAALAPTTAPTTAPTIDPVAERAYALKDAVLGMGEVFPTCGEGLRAIYRAAKGDPEVRAYIMRTTWAGRWATMLADEAKEAEEAC